MNSDFVFSEYFPSWIIANTFDKEIDFSITKNGSCFSQKQTCYLEKYFEAENVGGFSEYFSICQVHGDEIVVLKKDDVGLKNSYELLPEADGIVTDCLGLPIAIRTADCVPIFIFDEKKKVVGLVHAGWRSSELQILKKAVDIFLHNWNSSLEDIRVVFGPSIRNCCYEVGVDFKVKFEKSIFYRNGTYWLDLVEENMIQVKTLGIKEDQIYDCGICTCCNEEYFSYRRSGSSTGRNLSLMMIKEV